MGVPAVIVTLNHLEGLPENLSYFIRNSDSFNGDTQIQPIRFIRRHDNGPCFDYFRQMAVLSGLSQSRVDNVVHGSVALDHIFRPYRYVRRHTHGHKSVRFHKYKQLDG